MADATWLLADAVGELTALAQPGGLPLAALFESPLASTAVLTSALAAACWLGNLTGYWSWVDRLWSVLPPVVALVFAVAGADNPRLLLLVALIVTWGARLTYNFWRKGGYNDEEDYRWPVLRGWFKAYDPLHPLVQEAFSLGFVACYQLALIWAFTAAPLYVVSRQRGAPLTWLDYACTAAFLVSLVLETVTDEVQWRFQARKYALTPTQRRAAGGDVARGFCTSGPFAYSRHLNFACEQAIWWCVYGFAVCAGAPVVHWSAVGAALLSGLFQGSTWMTEALTAAKYPAYRAYQRTTSRLLPWLPGPSLDSDAGAVLVSEALAAARTHDKRA